MEKFSLAEALRYIVAGFVFLGCLWYYNPAVEGLLTKLGPLGVTIVALAIGAIMYPVYRGLFYNPLMPHLQDFFRKESDDNYRTYLQREYGLKSKSDAIRLYVALRDRDFPKVHQGAESNIANVHMGYISALIFLAFGLGGLLSMSSSMHKFIMLFPTGVIVFWGTFLFERRIQSDELNWLLMTSKDKIHAMMETLGITGKKGTG